MQYVDTLNMALVRNTKTNTTFQEIYIYIVVQL